MKKFRQSTVLFIVCAFLLASLIPGIVSTAATPDQANFAVRYRTDADWGGGFNGSIVVVNNGAEPLNNWTLEFDWNRTISGIWDAQVVSRVGNRYRIKSAGWNDSIPAGGSIFFGFGGSPGNVTDAPFNFVVGSQANGTPTPTATATATPNVTPSIPPTPDVSPTATPTPNVTPTPTPNVTPTPSVSPTVTPSVSPTANPAGVTAKIVQTGNWNGGFSANLEIFNNTNQTVDGWTLQFNFATPIQSLWNGVWAADGNVYTVRNESWNGTIAPGGRVVLGLTGAGTLALTSANSATFNGAACPIFVELSSTNPTPPNPNGRSVVVGNNVDRDGESLQITIAQGVSSFPLTLTGNVASDAFTVASNNPTVAAASIIDGNTLRLNGLKAGRAGLRIKDTTSGATRYIGVRVKKSNGSLPGMPEYLALGSVSEDTDTDLSFWHEFDQGDKNRRVDARYIYLNGGPYYGWSTWTNVVGDRARRYIRESKRMGMIPIFVWYNIPDGGESYYTDLEHIQSAQYMRDYYQQLKLFTDIIRAESPDDPVGVIIEPDFIGYMAQNSTLSPVQIQAFTSSAYEVGALQTGVDPQFPNNLKGLVESINYIFSRDTPQTHFGWQMNLWASPAGGFTIQLPGTGIVHLTDNRDINTGRQQIYREAAAITDYYIRCGVKSYGANFLSIDKYGLDAATAEAAAANDPANSTWFWNSDHWTNYLVFVRAMHETADLPVVLWQLPVGHINSSQAVNPYAENGLFPDLTNNNRQGEDSAPTFFFGDTFTATGARFDFFSANRAADSSVSTVGNTIVWGEHLTAAKAAGVTMALFGAGVGGSTTNVGAPPSDGFWWITKAQRYYARPVPLGRP